MRTSDNTRPLHPLSPPKNQQPQQVPNELANNSRYNVNPGSQYNPPTHYHYNPDKFREEGAYQSGLRQNQPPMENNAYNSRPVLGSSSKRYNPNESTWNQGKVTERVEKQYQEPNRQSVQSADSSKG